MALNRSRSAAASSRPRVDTDRPFTRADAVAAGVPDSILRGSAYRRIFRGVYVDARVKVDEVVRARAGLMLHPDGAFASHLTAAEVYRLPVAPSPDVHISVRDEGDRRPRPGLRSHLSPAHVQVTTHRGVPVSAADDTFLALAQLLSLIDLVVVGDAMVRLNLVQPEELVATLDASKDHNAVLARRAARYVRRGVDSPMETRLRMLIVLSGLPEPDVNHIICDSDGNVLMRFDLSYPWLKLLIEYDGRQHAEDTAQWNRDIERREALDRLGWRIIVVTSRGIYREPTRTLARIQLALRERGCVPLPQRLSSAWQPHFPH